MRDLFVYGSYGYSGSLIVAEAVKRGLEPTLGGRDARRLEQQAKSFRLPFRAFALGDTVSLDASLASTKVALHCAGPFRHTWSPMVEACLRAGVHYLDITGEIEVFESMAALDSRARAAEVMLLPGVGFDVVPSDCLAAHLKRRLPTATSLALAIDATGGLSRGTVKTIAASLGRGAMIRTNGELVSVPIAWKTRRVDFGTGSVSVVTVPLADLSTAYRTTGIPNVEVYLAVGGTMRLAMRLSRSVGWLLRGRTVREFLSRRADHRPAGPDLETRAHTASFVWGEARDDAGQVVVSRLRGPNGYALTATVAVNAAARVLNGEHRSGFQTPAGMFGPDFVLAQGVTREDVAPCVSSR